MDRERGLLCGIHEQPEGEMIGFKVGYDIMCARGSQDRSSTSYFEYGLGSIVSNKRQGFLVFVTKNLRF